jgi:alpha-N-arabinofuranosidase
MILNEMFRHTDFLKMAAYTMSVSTIDYNPTVSTYNSRGLLYKMYRERFGTIPVALSGNSPQPAPTRRPYGDQPMTSSGSLTYPLDMVAALTDDHKYLTVAVVNATDREHEFNLGVTGMKAGGLSTVWQLSGGDLNRDNHVGEPQQIFVKEVPLSNASRPIAVAPSSVDIYRFPLEQ